MEGPLESSGRGSNKSQGVSNTEGPQTQQELDAALFQDSDESGGPSSSAPEDNLEYYQAFTLLLSVGHSHENIVDMGLDEFKGYTRAAMWLRNLNTDTSLNVATIATSAAFSGNKGLFEHIAQYRLELKTAHKNVK